MGQKVTQADNKSKLTLLIALVQMLRSAIAWYRQKLSKVFLSQYHVTETSVRGPFSFLEASGISESFWR